MSKRHGNGKRPSPSAPDWDALRARSLGKGGFGEERVEIWPRLLNVSASPRTTRPESVSKSKPAPEIQAEPEAPTPHEDERQIGLDTDRSFVLYPVESKLPRETLQKGLHELLVSLFRKRPKLSYFQGYHDIVTVFFLTLPPDLQLPCIEKMSLHRLRDSMGHGLEPVLGLLRVTNNLLHLADPEYARLLEGVSPMPFYALSNLLTLFAHDMPTLPLIQHVFDYLLCRPPIAVVYLATAIILARKREAIQLEQDDEDGMIHSLLSSLPDLVDDHDDPSAEEIKVKKEEDGDGDVGENTTFFAADGGLNLGEDGEGGRAEVKVEEAKLDVKEEEQTEVKVEEPTLPVELEILETATGAGRLTPEGILPGVTQTDPPSESLASPSNMPELVEKTTDLSSTPAATTTAAPTTSMDLPSVDPESVVATAGLKHSTSVNVDPPPYSPSHSRGASGEIKVAPDTALTDSNSNLDPSLSNDPDTGLTANSTGAINNDAATKSETGDNTTTDPLPSQHRPKNKMVLTDLLRHADSLYVTYPPTHPDLALSSIMGPQSVVFTWSESFSALSSDDECEAMVAHPELVVYPAVEADVDGKEEGSGAESDEKSSSRSRRYKAGKGKVSGKERRRRRRMLSSYKAPFGPVEKKTVLAGTVLVLGVAMAVYGIKASSQPGNGSTNARDWKKVGGWVGGALAGISRKVLDVAAGSGHGHGTP